MTVTGLCPALGEGWLAVVPKDSVAADDTPADGTLVDIQATYAEISAVALSEASKAADFHWADGP